MNIHDRAAFLFGKTDTRYADEFLAQTSCRSRKSIENLLQIERRAADDLKDFGSRSLLLQRFAEIVGALADFVEQPRILDGDHSLIGECLDERQLPFRVPESGLRVSKDDRADALFPIDQRREGDGSKATRGC